MRGGRALALGIGLAIVVSYGLEAIGFITYGLPVLLAVGTPDALEAAQALQGSWVASAWGVSCEFAIGALLLGHVVHAARTRRLSRRARAFWVFALLAGNVVALPIYWYRHVWRPAVLAPRRTLSDQERFAAFLARRSQGHGPDAPPTRGPA
jgi:hypothetical protein